MRHNIKKGIHRYTPTYIWMRIFAWIMYATIAMAVHLPFGIFVLFPSVKLDRSHLCFYFEMLQESFCGWWLKIVEKSKAIRRMGPLECSNCTVFLVYITIASYIWIAVWKDFAFSYSIHSLNITSNKHAKKSSSDTVHLKIMRRDVLLVDAVLNWVTKEIPLHHHSLLSAFLWQFLQYRTCLNWGDSFWFEIATL